MGRHVGRVDPYARRLPPGNAEPQDAWMPVSERRDLERINEKFLMLLKQEKWAAQNAGTDGHVKDHNN